MSDTSEETQTHNPLFVDDNTTFETLEIKTINLSEEQINNEKKNTLTDEEKFNLMKEIEIKTENKMKELYKTGELIPPSTPEIAKKQMDLLDKTMQVGANEFKEKMGRNMTYSEMRMMFG
jgi:hypothetical protein